MQAVDKIPADAWPAVLDEMQHRLVTLELELRQLASTSAFHTKAYEQRVKRLGDMKAKLANVRQRALRRTAADSHDWQSLFPNLSRCSQIERRLVSGYCRDQAQVLNELIATNQAVVQETQKVLRSGLGLFGMFSFSRLRKLLSLSENLQIYVDRKAKETQARAEALLQGSRWLFDRPKNADVRGMIALFDSFDDLYSRLQRLRSKIGKKKAEVEWKKSWLTVQQGRVANYSPSGSNAGLED